LRNLRKLPINSPNEKDVVRAGEEALPAKLEFGIVGVPKEVLSVDGLLA